MCWFVDILIVFFDRCFVRLLSAYVSLRTDRRASQWRECFISGRLRGETYKWLIINNGIRSYFRFAAGLLPVYFRFTSGYFRFAAGCCCFAAGYFLFASAPIVVSYAWRTADCRLIFHVQISAGKVLKCAGEVLKSADRVPVQCYESAIKCKCLFWRNALW